MESRELRMEEGSEERKVNEGERAGESTDVLGDRGYAEEEKKMSRVGRGGNQSRERRQQSERAERKREMKARQRQT